MKTIALAVLVALVGTAAAQDSKTEPKKPALNLRLDEASSAAPRVTFGPPASTQTKEEREKGLPELGGKPSQAYDRPVSSSSSSGAVIPNAMEPSVNSSQSTYGGR